MEISVTPLEFEDAQAIVDAEDDQTIRFLSGGPSTLEGTQAYITRLEQDAAAGVRKRAFAIRADGVVVGTIDVDPNVTDGLEPGDVNIAYGIAPPYRGLGITVRAVEIICSIIAERHIGSRAVIRADVRNPASARVAEKAGFRRIGDVASSTETAENGSSVILQVFARPLL